MIELSGPVLLGAFVLDLILGDPGFLPHPVIYMGKAIQTCETWFRVHIRNLLVSGAFLAVLLVSGTWLAAYLAVRCALWIHPMAGDLVQMGLLFFCFSVRSLEKSALHVFQALAEQDLGEARQRLSMIVGRQTEHLDETGISRAAVETVAENFVDGFLSPLFFAVIGGAPLALAYKMINTLDSMVGYRNPTYILFGRFSARMDDAANFIPARLSVPVIALAGVILKFRKGGQTLKTGFFQGSLHKSPNSGYPEAAFAGALEIKLGGSSYYHGSLVEKPFIGGRFKDPEPGDILKACRLMKLAAWVAVLPVVLLILIF